VLTSIGTAAPLLSLNDPIRITTKSLSLSLSSFSKSSKTGSSIIVAIRFFPVAARASLKICFLTAPIAVPSLIAIISLVFGCSFSAISRVAFMSKSSSTPVTRGAFCRSISFCASTPQKTTGILGNSKSLYLIAKFKASLLETMIRSNRTFSNLDR